MSIISVSSPFLKSFTHSTTNVNTSIVTLLAAAQAHEKRISIIIQNQSSTATVTVILSATDTTGIILQPATFFNIDNYNGTVRVVASAATTPVHLAYAVV
jgi:spore maturation protein SpmB